MLNQWHYRRRSDPSQSKSLRKYVRLVYFFFCWAKCVAVCRNGDEDRHANFRRPFIFDLFSNHNINVENRNSFTLINYVSVEMKYEHRSFIQSFSTPHTVWYKLAINSSSCLLLSQSVYKHMHCDLFRSFQLYTEFCIDPQTNYTRRNEQILLLGVCSCCWYIYI